MFDAMTAARNLLNAIIPISRFNKGEASKIFDEVKKSGYKVVIKNNKPTCVLVTPERYQEMMEIIEDYSLALEADKRMKGAKDKDFVGHQSLMEKFGVSEKDLDASESELEE